MVICRRSLVLILPFLVFSFLLSVGFASDKLVGSAAPAFKIESGDDETLTLDDLKGKVVVLFYETKSVIEQNRKLKTALNAFYAVQPEDTKNDIVRIGVIDCKGVLFGGVWRKNLRDNSAKEGITIYGDWDGKMSSDYRANESESNVIIIDKEGIIRYYASGQVKDDDIVAIEELLKSLVNER